MEEGGPEEGGARTRCEQGLRSQTRTRSTAVSVMAAAVAAAHRNLGRGLGR